MVIGMREGLSRRSGGEGAMQGHWSERQVVQEALGNKWDSVMGVRHSRIQAVQGILLRMRSMVTGVRDKLRQDVGGQGRSTVHSIGRDCPIMSPRNQAVGWGHCAGQPPHCLSFLPASCSLWLLPSLETGDMPDSSFPVHPNVTHTFVRP